ncbi:Rft-1-domain-containing protein [Trichodelitschia bisporula]|uniref:Man(5)GlcNAc(2)-PP-dolichol translocation protein RFT1 n=1 Tax=Trichodelitschia bisporula TaxID=703511 RepID=A0A6G1I356_9PEZI|nr:Rft-1-domain-containing protein [Trichodelitschia bisporula]
MTTPPPTSGATTLILLQIASRAFTFAVNQILLRYLSPSLLAAATQLDLYAITVLYFARESLRVAVTRLSESTKAIVNLACLSVGLGCLLVVGVAALYRRAGVPPVPYFLDALNIYAGACVIELLSEPAFVAAQQRFLYGLRASAETAANLTRCVVTCGVGIWASKTGVDIGVMPFALGQLGYSIVLLGVYTLRTYPHVKRDQASLLPTVLDPATNPILLFFNRPLLSLSLSLSLQNTLKYILTQGDGLLIASLLSLPAQGSYALASNYGSLIARLLFQPIEESSRALFARNCAPQGAGGQVGGEPSKSGLHAAASTLTFYLRFYTLLALPAISLGPSLAPLLLHLVAGPRWARSDASAVLARYALYIPLLALNGVSEAFVAAVASERELHTQSAWMGFFFVAWAGAAWVLMGELGLGAVGLVWANCVNMGGRIWFNGGFVRGWFGRYGMEFEIGPVLPRWESVAVAVAAAAVLNASVPQALKELGLVGEVLRVGGVSGVFGVFVLWFEREWLLQAYRDTVSKREEKQEKKVK